MRIYRIAAMFKTFGLEDELLRSFESHYKKMKSDSSSNPDEVMDRYSSKKFLYLGGEDITKAMESIIDNYGYPQVEIPKKIYFGLIHPDNPKFPSDASAFFYGGSDGVFYILKVEPNPFNVVIDDAFYNTIRHETQHFLRYLYDGARKHSSPEKDNGEIESYYGSPWEIQAYAGNIANAAINNIKTVIGYGMENKSPEHIEKVKGNMRKKKDMLASSFLVKSLKRFFDGIEAEKEIPYDIKKKYYQSAYRDFSRLFDEYFA